MKSYLDADEISLRAGETLHRAVVEQREVAFVLRRSERRSLALRIDRGRLRVNAPRRASLSQIHCFIEANASWVIARLESSAVARAARQRTIVDGMTLILLGRPLRLRLTARRRSSAWQLSADGVEELLLPQTRCLEALERALRVRAIAWFEGRVAEACLRLGVAVPRVALSAAATRWGSCSTRTGIRLHWKLALLSPAVASYVVAHEVAHLREMNHSERFWRHVADLCPDWRTLRSRLRQEGATLPEFVMPAESGAQCEEERV